MRGKGTALPFSGQGKGVPLPRIAPHFPNLRVRLYALALLACIEVSLSAAAPPLPAPYEWHLPPGFPVPAVPADNPMSTAKVALGRRLFFETRLSVTGRYSCASCHDPARSFSDGRAVALGARGDPLPHNALTLVNVAYNLSYGWTNPEVRTLELQMLEPLLNEHPVELGLAGREQQVVDVLFADSTYRRAFETAFPQTRPPVSLDTAVKAIAAFERTLISGQSPFDLYVFGGIHDALSDEAKRGMALFFSARVGCADCHSGFNFSGNWLDAQGATGKPSFANNGTSDAPMRVPTLRNLAFTGPYMHDGRFATLAEVLDHYERVGAEPDSAQGGERDPRLKRFELTPSERSELLAFLATLSDATFVAEQAAGGAGH